MKKMTITGNIGANPRIFYDINNRSYVSFAVAVKAPKNDKPEWVYINCYSTEAQFALNYLHQGDKVLVEGVPSVTLYVNKNGEPRANQRILAHLLELLAAKPDKPIPTANDNVVYAELDEEDVYGD